MTFKLEDLKYDYNALEEVIDEETMRIHHYKHHQGYVDKLNDAVKDTEYANANLEELLANLDNLPEKLQKPVRNNGGGHYNHTLFWETMTPGGSNEPVGKVKEKIEETFGSFEDFKKKFEEAGAGQFGSGWAWLVSKDGKLEVTSTPNQDNPISQGFNILLGNDVWEHAYYLRYQNKRADYLKNWWKVVNWDVVESRFK